MTKRPLPPFPPAGPNWKKACLRAGTSRRAMQQKTRDAMDKDAALEDKYGQRQSEAQLVQLDQAALEGFDRMVILDGIRKDQGCLLVARFAKCTLEEAAERILWLVGEGFMTIGIHEGKIRTGITRNGWVKLSRFT